MIALTGGPCGGKSTCLNQLVKRLQEHQFNVLIAPEMPTLLKQMCECPFPFVPNASASDALHMRPVPRSSLMGTACLDLEQEVLSRLC